MSYLRSANLYAALGILVIVVAIFVAGQRHEARKAEAEIAKLNVPIAEQRGKDESEMVSEAKEAARVDASVSGALTQQCIMTAETAKRLSEVR